MNALQPDDLDPNTKACLFQHIADMVAEAIGATATQVDPGSSVLFVDEWWAEVVVDGYNQMTRTEAAEVESIVGLHVHGVPVQPDETARFPTVREPVEELELTENLTADLTEGLEPVEPWEPDTEDDP